MSYKDIDGERFLCQFCLKYGNGKKWYLNEENYTDEAIKNAMSSNPMIKMLGGTQKMDLEIGAAMSIDSIVPDINNQGQLKNASKTIETLHGGQILPLEEAFMVLDLAKSYILVPCYCLCYQFTGRDDQYPQRQVCRSSCGRLVGVLA